MSNITRIGVDIDGCLAQFNEAYAKLLVEEHGENLIPEGGTFCCWDWDIHYGFPLAVRKAVLERNVWGSDDFWLKLEPIPGACDTIRKLHWLAHEGKADVYYLTNRHGATAKKQTEKWLYNNGCDYPTVLIAVDKTPIIKSLGLQLYVDDRLDAMAELVRQARYEKWPQGIEHFYLKDAPWNQENRTEGLQVAGSVREALEKAGLWK